MSEYLRDESCERCGGPLLVNPHIETTFIEESLDYVEQTFWSCASCGYANPLQSTPHYLR